MGNFSENKVLCAIHHFYIAVVLLAAVLLASPLEVKAETVDYSAEAYTLNTKVTHHFTANGDKWYKVSLDKAYILSITADHTDFVLYDSNSQSLEGLYCMHDKKSGYAGLIKGDYYFKLVNHNGDSTVECSINVVEPESNYQSFVESYNDPSTRNNSEPDATTITAGNTYHGIIGVNNYIDWYKLTLSGNTKVQFSVRNYRDYVTGFTMLDQSGNKVFEVSSGAATESKIIPAGTYTIRVERFNPDNNDRGISSYQIAVGSSEEIDKKAASLISSKPKLSVKKGGKVTVKWNQATDVAGYEIQIAGKKSFKGAKTYTVNNATKKTIKLPKKLAGKKIYVRVRAFSENNGSKTFSQWSKTASKKSKK